MAGSSIRNKFVYLFALTSAIVLFGFNVIFNIKSSHHSIRTIIPDYSSSYRPQSAISTHTRSLHDFHNTTNPILNTSNNKLKQHQPNTTNPILNTINNKLKQH
eukprot:434993_1